MAVCSWGEPGLLPPDACPLLVGGHAHGAANIRALRDLGVGNFVWIPKVGYEPGNTPWDRDPAAPNGVYADVDAAIEAGFRFAISQRRGLGRVWRPGGGHYGGDCWGDDLLAPETVAEIARRAGKLFVGLHAEELDADFLQNGIRRSFQSRLPALYGFTDRAGGRRAFEEELTRQARKYRGYAPGTRYWPNLSVGFQHSGYRAGANLVMGELLESLPTTELQLAYLRGAGNQFARPWGVWVSPWHHGTFPCEDKKLWPHRAAQRGGGHAASAFRRCLYLAYASGCRVFTMQETEPIFSLRDPDRPGGGYVLAAWGRELKAFWDYVRAHPAPVRPVVRTAFLVDRDSGWAPGNLHGGWVEHETVWAKLPVTTGDKMLSGYLDVLIPGFRRDQEGAWAKDNEYPGYFAETPGGAVDVVTSDIAPDRLSRYARVWVMGQVTMTHELLATLRAYVERGGELHVNACQMWRDSDFVQDEAFLGARIGMSTMDSAWAGGELTGRRVFSSNQIVTRGDLPGVRRGPHAAPWYVCQDVQVTTADVVATCGVESGSKQDEPVLLRHRFGRGRVFLSTPEFLVDGYGDRTAVLPWFRDWLLAAAADGPVRVTGRDVSWTAAVRGRNERLIVLANHAGEERTAQIELGSDWADPGQTLRVEHGGGSLVGAHTPGGCAVLLPPEDVAVVLIESERPAE